MSTNRTPRTLALAAGVALIGAASAARAEVAGGVIGCDASGNKQIVGALIGGVLGGVAGNNIIKKDQQAGTIVGATAGAATGSYVGCQMQKKDAERGATTSSSYRTSRPESEPYAVREAPRPVVYEAPPRAVVYETAPPRTVYVRERDDEDYDYDRMRKKRHPHGMPPGQAKKYLVGERMPVAYVRQRDYIIVEPARYRLRPAPVGYRWLMLEGDAYLVGVDTGIVSQIVRAILG